MAFQDRELGMDGRWPISADSCFCIWWGARLWNAAWKATNALLRITENALHSLPEKGYRWFQAQSDCYIRQRVGKAALIAFRAISSALDVDPASLQ